MPLRICRFHMFNRKLTAKRWQPSLCAHCRLFNARDARKRQPLWPGAPFCASKISPTAIAISLSLRNTIWKRRSCKTASRCMSIALPKHHQHSILGIFRAGLPCADLRSHRSADDRDHSSLQNPPAKTTQHLSHAAYGELTILRQAKWSSISIMASASF